MGRRSSQLKERHHVHLFEGDWEWLSDTYGRQGVTPSAVIAKLVSNFRRKVVNKAAARVDQLPPNTEDIEIDLTIGSDIGTSVPTK